MLGQILLIVLIVLAWLGVRSIIKERRRVAEENERLEREAASRDAFGRERPPHGSRGHTEDMVRCAQCGVYAPRSQVLDRGGKSYCSEECRAGHGPPST